MSALQVPPLEGWVTVAQAAEILGITRQAVHKKILDGSFTSTRRLGPVSKPIFVLARIELVNYQLAKAES